MLESKIWRALFYFSSIFMMLYFGFLTLESYKAEAWLGAGVSLGYFMIGCWTLFGVSFTPKEKFNFLTPEQVEEKEANSRHIFVATPSERGSNAVLFPKGQYVYLIQDVSVTGYCKIGRTNLPAKRLYDFGVHLPMRLSVVHIIPTDNMVHLETYLHRIYANKRINGEWFALEPNDIEYIKTL